jgi:predicted ester cyclase
MSTIRVGILQDRRFAMSEKNVELLRTLLGKAMNENDTSQVDALVAPSYVNHDAPVPVRGPEGFKQLVGMFRRAFPDLQVVVDDIFADGDLVGSRGAITGTHGGDFMGVPATGRRVNFGYIDLWRVEDGRFTDTWVQMDALGLMQQIGALPSAAA